MNTFRDEFRKFNFIDGYGSVVDIYGDDGLTHNEFKYTFSRMRRNRLMRRYLVNLLGVFNEEIRNIEGIGKKKNRKANFKNKQAESRE